MPRRERIDARSEASLFGSGRDCWGGMRLVGAVLGASDCMACDGVVGGGVPSGVSSRWGSCAVNVVVARGEVKPNESSDGG